MAEGRARVKSQRPKRTLKSRFVGNDSPVTYTLIGIIAVMGVLQWLTRSAGMPVFDELFTYSPQYTDMQHHLPSGAIAFEPWRMLTSAFLHGSLMHFLMNALTLWIFGRALEPLLGSGRFLLLWIVSALGGSLAVALISPDTAVVGASGAVFGLFGAWFIVLRQQRQDMTPMFVLIGINVVMAFINPGISWEAHLGGLVIGALCGWLTLTDLGKARKRTAGIWLQILVGVLCVAIPPAVGALL
ncbi:MAG: rhomboid family intramembrane serine protease [Gulosibacter sp.]|uniref:rhomboid family intramembrane serine protease n=1 Tax=Gulosibacter sp. TaxID=2817531 RepID=UPI003F8F1C5A